MRYLSLFFLLLVSFPAISAERDSLLPDLPDTVKAVSFISDIKVMSVSRKESEFGIGTGEISVTLESDGKEREVNFRFPASAGVVATGLDVQTETGELEWDYNWQLNTTYKLLIASAADSAGNFTLFSGYIFLPGEKNWKLIGTCRVNGKRSMIAAPRLVIEAPKDAASAVTIGNSWVQRVNGSWRKLGLETAADTRPVTNPMPSYDSLRQFQQEKTFLDRAIAAERTDATNTIEGIYYKIIDAGTGKEVKVTDTVTVKYQLRIFGTTETIDAATDKPATFPLNRLIKAWQIAVPLVKTGGRLKIVIPSGLAYSIRTRAPKIPPNSILEFDIEVIDAKPQQQ